jgi:hypothetical protein
MALAVFKHLGAIPGQVLAASDFMALAATNRWRNLDVLDGVKAGYAKGLFDEGPNYGIQLTANGFAAISTLNDPSQAETDAVTKSIETNQAETSANWAQNEMNEAVPLLSNGEETEHDQLFAIFNVEEKTTVMDRLLKSFSLRLPGMNWKALRCVSRRSSLNLYSFRHRVKSK